MMQLILPALLACFSGAPCRSDAQCAGDLQCIPGGHGYGCGTEQQSYECGDTATCDTAAVCVAFYEGCTVGSECVPRCEDDGGCSSTQKCDTVTHACVDRPCTDAAVTCPDLTVCDPGSGACVAKPCIGDSVCGTGFCVNGGCASEPGKCSGALP